MKHRHISKGIGKKFRAVFASDEKGADLTFYLHIGDTSIMLTLMYPNIFDSYIYKW